jgi:alkylhydroperoxidase family enzyme
MRLDQPRLAPLDPTEIDPELWDRLRGNMKLNIFATLAHHPKLAKRQLVLGNHILYKSSLSGRVREIAILRVGWLCRAEYEFGQHTEIGRGEGLTDDEITRLTAGPGAPGWTDAERAVLRATDELHDDAFVSDATWADLGEHFTTEQILDLLFVVGYYHTISMVLNTLGVQLEPGKPGFPPGSPAPPAP